MDSVSVQNTLDTIRRIKGKSLFYDLHVHPFEVIFSSLQYRSDPKIKGLFSTQDARYLPPQLSAINLDASELESAPALSRKLRNKLCLLNSRRFYPHTGSRVFLDQMQLCGIDRALLLPVPGMGESGNARMEAMSAMFRDRHFLFGYAVPNDISNERIGEAVRSAVRRYKIKALKIHPAITGLDLSHSTGIDRVERILAAAQQCRLKVVVHGGLSPDCQDPAAIAYACAKNLQHVDWSLTTEPVIIAHGGFYGHTVADCRKHVAPLMLKLLEHYDHLVVDTSGLPYDSIRLLLQLVACERVVFGSDALYEKPWMSMVKLWHALLEEHRNPEAALMRITSNNPRRLLNEKKNAATSAHGETGTVRRRRKYVGL